MANTVIQLKHSTVQGNVPVSLANGEISINTRDGKIFYAEPDGTVVEFSTPASPSGLNGEIQFNDSGSSGANSRLTFEKTTGTFRTNNVTANSVASNTYIQFGDGTKQYTANVGSGTGSAAKITLALTPPSNNANGDIWISSTSGKKFTWFTDEDSAQWVEFGPNGIKGDPGDLSNANLAFNAANSAFIQANAAFLAANNATDTYVRNHANSAFIQANAAFTQANSAVSVSRSYALGMFLY